jgi:myo-inositol 2-dehydrogenase/D-chiro-inositol 1-dehydrogenase
MTMSDRVRIGVLGTGRIGRLHARNLAFRIEGAEVVAVADPDREAVEACARACRVERVHEDPRRLLEDPEVDAVAICSSTDCHAEQIELAADAGKHIFCEKPIDLDLARIDAALARVEQHGVKLMVGFNRRYDPGFRCARELIATGRIGTPHLVRITSRDPAPPPPAYVKVSGGLFLDMTIHDFDMARWIIDSEVEEIHAMSAVLVDPAIGELGDVDTAMISLRYASGALGSIDNSRQAVYGYDQRLEVFGSEGCVVVGNETPSQAVLSRKNGVVAEKPLHFFVERYEAAYVAELQEFVDCLLEDRELPVTGKDGRIPVLMALAAQRSRAFNRPVKVAGS